MTNKLISLVLLVFFLTTGYSYSEDQFLFPKKKPSVFKEVERNIGSENWKNLPQKKPIIGIKKEKIVKDVQVDKGEIEEKKQTVLKKKVKTIQKKEVFLLPQKKPITYKVQSKTIEKSTVLNEKDFERAKETIKFIKARKWNSALKSAKKVKNSEFRTLVTWMHLKTTRNSATFNDYKNFIEQHEDYPRINRIKYLAETKVYLRNNSPTSIINWFDRHPPLYVIHLNKLSQLSK